MSVYKSEWSRFIRLPEGMEDVDLEMEKLMAEEEAVQEPETEKLVQEHAGGRKQNLVPIPQKFTLTISEAAAYSNIGIHKLNSMLKSPRCPFVLYVGSKKLVKRAAFEKYLSSAIEI